MGKKKIGCKIYSDQHVLSIYIEFPFSYCGLESVFYSETIHKTRAMKSLSSNTVHNHAPNLVRKPFLSPETQRKPRQTYRSVGKLLNVNGKSAVRVNWRWPPVWPWAKVRKKTSSPYVEASVLDRCTLLSLRLWALSLKVRQHKPSRPGAKAIKVSTGVNFILVLAVEETGPKKSPH